jgi:hypothetical protein
LLDIAHPRDEKDHVELNELTRDELLALVGLLERVVAADSDISDDELEQLQTIIDRIGERTYADAVGELDRRYPNEEGLRALLGTVQRQEARESIWGTVFEAAIPDSIHLRESPFLEWLAKEWGLTLSFETPSERGT